MLEVIDRTRGDLLALFMTASCLDLMDIKLSFNKCHSGVLSAVSMEYSMYGRKNTFWSYSAHPNALEFKANDIIYNFMDLIGCVNGFSPPFFQLSGVGDGYGVLV